MWKTEAYPATTAARTFTRCTAEFCSLTIRGIFVRVGLRPPPAIPGHLPHSENTDLAARLLRTEVKAVPVGLALPDEFVVAEVGQRLGRQGTRLEPQFAI